MPAEACSQGLGIPVCRDGNRARQVWRIGSSSLPHMVLSYLISTSPRMKGKIFLLLPHPLGPHIALPFLVKLKFLLIYPQLLQFFLVKPILLIKIYLKLQINLSYQIKLIFRKYWIILLKCLTRQYHYKNKNLIIQNH